MVNFWSQLSKPILVLAPLAGVTDSAFRQICKSYGAQVVVSEMASVAALDHDQRKTLEMLAFQPIERPYIVQLFGSDPQQFAVAAQIITEKIQPDGLDINFGCPVPKIIKQGAGAALGADLSRAREVVRAVLDNTDRPLSIKLRAFNQGISAQQFVANLADLPIAAVAVHGRSLAAGFSGFVDPTAIAACRSYVNGQLLANGGIIDLFSAQAMLAASQADGLMIGQGALSRPWIFQEIAQQVNINLSWSELSQLMLRHAKLVVENKGQAGLMELRKFLAWYVKGWPQAKKIRQQLVAIKSIADLETIISNFCV
ncbi:MAG TPA: tRNA-dihydrouridine synthase [bacterium]|nr:tRNA-dihydrouridine synthase [bacterium]